MRNDTLKWAGVFPRDQGINEGIDNGQDNGRRYKRTSISARKGSLRLNADIRGNMNVK